MSRRGRVSPVGPGDSSTYLDGGGPKLTGSGPLPSVDVVTVTTCVLSTGCSVASRHWKTLLRRGRSHRRRLPSDSGALGEPEGLASAVDSTLNVLFLLKLNLKVKRDLCTINLPESDEVPSVLSGTTVVSSRSPWGLGVPSYRPVRRTPRPPGT